MVQLQTAYSLCQQDAALRAKQEVDDKQASEADERHVSIFSTSFVRSELVSSLLGQMKNVSVVTSAS